MLGYWRRPEANDEAFAGGWFHTGDMGRADEQGYTAIVDRKKDMIVTGGENVYSKEVEDVIYARPRRRRGVDHRPARPPLGRERHRRRRHRARRDRDRGRRRSPPAALSLAGYKKPKHVFFVDELPRNASGKILKRELRDRFT